MLPIVFVGSSVEGLEVAYAMQSNLHHSADVVVWDQGVFTASRYTLESIIDGIAKSDFALFVFTADDEIRIRGDANKAVRDNVLVELGVAIGKLGRERTFFVMPEDVDMHLPTDLLGITPVRYRLPREADRLQAALGHACNQLRHVIDKQPPGNCTFKTLAHDSAAIGEYMYEWIERGGRVAIFSRDLSWARSTEMLSLLRRKAAAKELIICVPEPIDLFQQLPGAEIYVYSALQYVPQSRFTFVHFGRGGARVAVGSHQAGHHIIQELGANNPAFYMASDLVELVTRLAREPVK